MNEKVGVPVDRFNATSALVIYDEDPTKTKVVRNVRIETLEWWPDGSVRMKIEIITKVR